jgi:hypothetical protein
VTTPATGAPATGTVVAPGVPTAAPGVPAAAPGVPELVARGVRTALQGDRVAALADLRAAYALETDPERRQRVAYVLAAAAGPTPMDYEACTRQATARPPGVAEPSASPGSPAIVPPPGSPGAAPPFSDRELLDQADRGVQEVPAARRVFLDCMRLRGY